MFYTLDQTSYVILTSDQMTKSNDEYSRNIKTWICKGGIKLIIKQESNYKYKHKGFININNKTYKNHLQNYFWINKIQNNKNKKI
jgi:hypothetical protein